MKKYRAFFWLIIPVLATCFCAPASSAPDSDLETFFEVCVTGSPADVRQALASVNDVNADDPEGITALMYAATWNKDPEVAAVLIRAGADVHARDIFGTTALMSAAGWNTNPEVLAVLIEAGAGIEDRDNEGMTALMMAAWSNSNPDVVMFLLESGANPGAETQDGHTAFYFVEENPELDNTEAYWALRDAKN